MRRLKARFTGGQRGHRTCTVRSWDPLTKKVVVGTTAVANARSNGARPAARAASATTGRQKAKAFAGALGTVDARRRQPGRGDAARQGARPARSATADLDVRCECLGDPKIKAGATVEIENAGHAS